MIKRWPVWTCGGIVVLGLLARLVLGGSSSKDGSEEKPGSTSVSPVTSTPAAGSLPSARYSPASLRRLSIDTLPPPPDDASPLEKAEYDRALKEIQAGRDPILEANWRQEERRAENQKRLQQRQEAARARVAEMRNKYQATMKAGREDLRQRLINAGHNPDAPPPPLFPTPKLGNPIVEYKTEPEKK